MKSAQFESILYTETRSYQKYLLAAYFNTVATLQARILGGRITVPGNLKDGEEIRLVGASVRIITYLGMHLVR
jgi:hypothetical protein